MKISIYSILLLSLFCKLNAQTVEASEFGFKIDAGNAIISALTSKYDTVIIDRQNLDWIIGPLLIKGLKNKVIIIEPNVEIVAKKDAFPNKSDMLFNFIDCENFQIIGNGAKLCMNKQEYSSGEWRHGISLRNCRDFVIENVEIKNTGGDGIYIAGTAKGTFSENITIDRVVSSNNKRQGISIISGKDITITNSVFENTIGTLPGSGIDLEPNKKHNRLQNIIFDNCISRNNDHSGISLSLGKLEKDSEPVSITFKNCVLQNNHNPDNEYVASEIVFGAHKTNPVGGQVTFNNCIVENSKWGLLYSRKINDAYHVTFNKCIARNICQDNSYPVIYLEVPDYYTGSYDLGGYTFEDFYLQYDTDVPILQIRGSTLKTLSHVSDITGSITLDGAGKTNAINYIKYNSSSNQNVNMKIQVLN